MRSEDPSSLRASDADRERVVEVLKAQTLAGRLTVEELGDRVAGAYQARTVAELRLLTADLPDERAVRARHEALPAPRMPGNRPFSDRFEIARARGRVMAEALAHIAPPLHNAGYELTRHSPDALEFTRESRPWWTIVGAVLLFPLGLLLLLHQKRSRILITFEEHGEFGTLMTTYGVAPLPVRRAFAELRS
jgi:DUF1707 SHOCT-like domain